MRAKIYKSKQKKHYVFFSGLISLVDGLIRVLSLGILTTNFNYEYVRYFMFYEPNSNIMKKISTFSYITVGAVVLTLIIGVALHLVACLIIGEFKQFNEIFTDVYLNCFMVLILLSFSFGLSAHLYLHKELEHGVY